MKKVKTRKKAAAKARSQGFVRGRTPQRPAQSFSSAAIQAEIDGIQARADSVVLVSTDAQSASDEASSNSTFLTTPHAGLPAFDIHQKDTAIVTSQTKLPTFAAVSLDASKLSEHNQAPIQDNTKNTEPETLEPLSTEPVTYDQSRLMRELHEQVVLLYQAGTIANKTMRDLETLYRTGPIAQYTGERIRHLREQYNLSQSALSIILNTSPSTVKSWEEEKNKPNGQACLLLNILENQGVAAFF